MKLTKKLLPALGMLALSTCMMVTSTFAWFSMNENVSATGMNVTAKGDQIYLQIKAGADNNVWADANGKALPSATATFSPTKNQQLTGADGKTYTYEGLLPVNVVKEISNTKGSMDVDGLADPVTTYSCTAYDGGAPAYWVTNIGYSNSNGVASTEYTDVTTDAKNLNGKYYIVNTFSIRMDPTAGAATAKGPLTISSIGTSTSADAFKGCVNVLVVSTIMGTSYGQVWEYDTDDDKFEFKYGNTALSNGNFSATQPAKVEIYVFFNGDDEDCTQTALAAAKDASYDVNVFFTVSAPANQTPEVEEGEGE